MNVGKKTTQPWITVKQYVSNMFMVVERNHKKQKCKKCFKTIKAVRRLENEFSKGKSLTDIRTIFEQEEDNFKNIRVGKF